MSSLREIEKKQDLKEPAAERKPAGNKKEYERRKAFERKKRALEKKIYLSEESISRLEGEIERIDGIMAEPEKIGDLSVYSEYEKLKSELFQEMTRWEQVHLELEKLIEQENK